MAEEIKQATIDAWFRERCRCAFCGAVATLGDLETCETCTDSIWRHECPETGETYIEHQIEHDRDRIKAERDQLKKDMDRLLAEVRNAVAWCEAPDQPEPMVAIAALRKLAQELEDGKKEER